MKVPILEFTVASVNAAVASAPPLNDTPLIAREVVRVAALPSIDVIPVNTKEADALFRATAVVPIYTVEFPNTADGIVPEIFPAVRPVRDAPLPENPVAVNIPVEGIKDNFVVEDNIDSSVPF